MFFQRNDSDYKIKTTAVSGDNKAFDVEIKKPHGSVVKFRVLASEVITRKTDNNSPRASDVRKRS